MSSQPQVRMPTAWRPAGDVSGGDVVERVHWKAAHDYRSLPAMRHSVTDGAE